MGRLSESVKRATIQKIGRGGWKRNANLIDQVWTKIEEVIEALPLRYEKVRLYQDGLPLCQRELEIVQDLAKTGSRNHQLLLRLKQRGAAIMGTESPELLVEEYQLIQHLLATGSLCEAAKIETQQEALSRSLLRERDQFIAHRINRTLRPGETGILFLGMLHSLEEWLDEDIEVRYPVNQPAQQCGGNHVKRGPPGSYRR